MDTITLERELRAAERVLKRLERESVDCGTDV